VLLVYLIHPHRGDAFLEGGNCKGNPLLDLPPSAFRLAHRQSHSVPPHSVTSIASMSMPLVVCDSAAPLYRCSTHSDPPSFPTFFPHLVTLVHQVIHALHVFSDLGLISIISAVLYISLHQQVDPYSFLFGSPARCASCLVYFLYNKLNTLDPLLVPRSARPQ